jgi:predicted nicotinamide N-methyase
METSLTVGHGSCAFRILLTHAAAPQLEHSRKKQCDLWAFVWASGSVCADVLWTTSCDFSMRSLQIAELGAGAGLPSLVACHHCGATVLATDLVPDALELIELNSSRLTNERSGSLATLKLDWGAAAATEAIAGAYHVVVGADVLYLGSSVRSVLRTAWHMLIPGGALVLVDPGRPTTESLEDDAASIGFDLVLRVEAAEYQTPVALMPKLVIFLLQKHGGVRDDTCIALAAAAKEVVSRTSAAAPTVRRGYTLDVSTTTK